MKEEDVIEWKQNLVVEFTHPEGREPVLMFNDKDPLKALITSPKPDRIGQARALYSAIDRRRHSQGLSGQDHGTPPRRQKP